MSLELTPPIEPLPTTPRCLQAKRLATTGVSPSATTGWRGRPSRPSSLRMRRSAPVRVVDSSNCSESWVVSTVKIKGEEAWLVPVYGSALRAWGLLGSGTSER
ncbi:hypothetical protein GCM10018791_70220 [Streptomyces zaomyceticus]|nr:hypothetical protein GCM10018791_70220 [Streptomyces zaomyceticus]